MGAIALAMALGVGATVATAGPASASVPAPRDITSGLDGPFGLQSYDRANLLVAENTSGDITKVNIRTGAQKVLISGALGVAAVAASPHAIFAVMGGGDETGAFPPGARFKPSDVVVANRDGSHARVLANLLTYELAHNPDGQVQFVDGVPPDALSNPFAMTYDAKRHRLLVADGGANDVLAVDVHSGRVSTFFAPSTFKDVPACQGPDANANPGTTGCDPVATGVAVAGNNVYVSFLGAEAPDAARIYKLDSRGHVKRVWKGFTSLTGVAVDWCGNIYASQVLEGAPEGEPPADFDPATVGQIVKISPNGHRSYAQVTMPTGLLWTGRGLFASTWSIAEFLGIEHAGKITQVPGRAFTG